MADDATPGGGPTPPWRPTFPAIRRIDELWHRGERLLCGGLFLIMALMVFASVVTETFGNRREWSDVAVLAVVCFLAARSRAVRPGETRWSLPVAIGVAAAATALIAGAVYVYTERYPGGFIWAQKLALVMMIWVALLGASMATYERSHLSLELGEKLWPASIVHVVKALALGLASGFCAAAALLAFQLVSHQRQEGLLIDANDWLPTWAAFVIVPYAFAAMTVRLAAQAVTTATGTAEPPEERLPS
ncbi:MAG TPA: TRAP transporter small permease [Kofleriaceae bacterium]|nr:TRAP transporter small permease [Kofleriaceae bacterium]